MPILQLEDGTFIYECDVCGEEFDQELGTSCPKCGRIFCQKCSAEHGMGYRFKPEGMTAYSVSNKDFFWLLNAVINIYWDSIVFSAIFYFVYSHRLFPQKKKEGFCLGSFEESVE